MKLLLDTCTFLWITTGSPALSRRAREMFTDPANEVFLSVVSGWEMALKHSLGRLPLPEPPWQFVAAQRESHGIRALALEEEAVLHVARLPKLHADPFDRMLVCQAIVHELTLLSPDDLIGQYAVRMVW